MSAPSCTRSVTARWWPYRAARCSGVSASSSLVVLPTKIPSCLTKYSTAWMQKQQIISASRWCASSTCCCSAVVVVETACADSRSADIPFLGHIEQHNEVVYGHCCRPRSNYHHSRRDGCVDGCVDGLPPKASTMINQSNPIQSTLHLSLSLSLSVALTQHTSLKICSTRAWPLLAAA
jgi:hypothetical protein